MIDETKFRARHPDKRDIGPFSSAELATMAKNLPAEIAEFLAKEGRCSYSGDRLWTVHPGEFHAILTDWGLDGKKCHAFIRTAFGGCVYYTRKNFYSFDSLTGTVNCLNDDIYTLMSVYLTFTFLLHDTWHLDRLDGRTDLPGLLPDEVYAVQPDGELTVAKMQDQLAALARSFDHKVTRL